MPWPRLSMTCSQLIGWIDTAVVESAVDLYPWIDRLIFTKNIFNHEKNNMRTTVAISVMA